MGAYGWSRRATGGERGEGWGKGGIWVGDRPLKTSTETFMESYGWGWGGRG